MVVPLTSAAGVGVARLLARPLHPVLSPPLLHPTTRRSPSVSPGADPDIYFPYSQGDRRLTSLHAEIRVRPGLWGRPMGRGNMRSAPVPPQRPLRAKTRPPTSALNTLHPHTRPLGAAVRPRRGAAGGVDPGRPLQAGAVQHGAPGPREEPDRPRGLVGGSLSFVGARVCGACCLVGARCLSLGLWRYLVPVVFSGGSARGPAWGWARFNRPPDGCSAVSMPANRNCPLAPLAPRSPAPSTSNPK